MKKWIFRFFIVLSVITVLFFFTNDRSRITAKIHGYNTLKVFAQAKSRELMPEFKHYESSHFIIKYRDVDSGSIDEIGTILEASYETVGEAYQYYPQAPILVFVYASQQEMWDYQWSVRGQAVMGVYDMGIIHILSPDAYLEEDENQMQEFETTGPVLHEYTHLVIDEMSGGNVELWLTEGLALYEEYAANGVEWAPDFVYERYYESRELRRDFAALDENQAYRQSFDLVRALVEEYGKEKVMTLLKELKKGYELNKAFSTVYGFSADTFINEFAENGN